MTTTTAAPATTQSQSPVETQSPIDTLKRVVLFVVSRLTAQLQAKVSARLLITAGLVDVAIGLVAMLPITAHSHWYALLPGMVIAAIGTGLFNPALSAVVLREADADNAGLAAGVNDTFRQGGIAVGVAALGSLVPAAGALGHGNGAAFVAGLQHATIVAAVLAGLGAIAAAILIDRNHRKAEAPEPATPTPIAAEPVPVG